MFYRNGWILKAHLKHLRQEAQEVTATGAASTPKSWDDITAKACLYGRDLERFMSEHTTRLTHVYFAKRHAAACLALPLTAIDPIEHEAQSNASGSGSWGRAFAVAATEAITLGQGPNGVDAFRLSVKRALALVLASLLSFVPSLRAATPQS